LKVLPNDPVNDIGENEFGLTDEEYRDLFEDIDQMRAEANEKWDFGAAAPAVRPKYPRRYVSKVSRLRQFLRYQRTI
jgi:hypothetical protein